MTDTVMERPQVEREEAEAFAERVGAMLDAGAAAAMMSLGHRLGLFDVLAGLPAATSADIAARAGLAERYVREWLAVMTTARIVEWDPATRRYRLPAARAACLTRGGALGNLAVYAQLVALMGAVEPRLMHCFRTGEGMAYEDYPCFHQFMEEDSAQTVTAALFDHVLPLDGGLEARLESGIDVLDAGCGRGSAAIALARRYPASRFTGYDLCPDAVDHAARAAADAGLSNVRFETRDLTGYREPDRWDLVASFDAVHDQKDPAGLVAGIAASLRPGGVYLMQDIGGSAALENNLDFANATLLYAISTAHCTPVSVGQGGEGLGTMWGWETAERLLRQAGFRDVERHVLPHDPMNVWFLART